MILGVWDGHDSGAAIIKDNRILAAENEERHTRRKLEVHFPHNAIDACLKRVNKEPKDISHIAYSTTDFSLTLTRLFPRIKESYYHIRRKKRKNRFPNLNRHILNTTGRIPPNKLTTYLSEKALRKELRRFPNFTLYRVNHHKAHAASAYYTSGMEHALVFTFDGLGDGLSGSVSLGKGKDLTLLQTFKTKDSLGLFYQEVTSLLGMRILEDEGKVMALADYGQINENPMKKLFYVDRGNIKSTLGLSQRYKFLKKLRQKTRPEQFARMAQETLENTSKKVIKYYTDRLRIKNVCFAGGIFANIKHNQAITGGLNWYIFPHMGDGGLAVGAALAIAPKKSKKLKLPEGKTYKEKDILKALSRYPFNFKKNPEPAKKAAELISKGEVVFWFQGGMEYGPRALGKRSILADPNKPEVKYLLNLKIKKREWYQPFCPSILESEAKSIFKSYTCSDPFMTMGYELKKDGLKATIDNNRCCRPQIIKDNKKGRYTELLHELKKITGTGAVLNTSFNIHGEPLVRTPEEALDVYQRTPCGTLIMEDFIITRC